MINKFLKAPFPYFGGKTMVADYVWSYLGNVEHYLEPFCGSAAVLLKRPGGFNLPNKFAETINDADGIITNIWRSIKYKPEETAEYADDIICHIDLYAKKKFIVNNYKALIELLQSDPEACDAKQAGYAIYNFTNSLSINSVDLYYTRPHLTGKVGINNNSIGARPALMDDRGINTKTDIYKWFDILSKRLRKVRITNSDWNILFKSDWQDFRWNTVGVFFDPPYSDVANRDNRLYNVDSMQVAHDVRKFCIEKGKLNNWRIVLAGYFDEHKELLDYGWTYQNWTANGGLGNQSKGKNLNKYKETLFISPYCENIQNKLF